MPTQEFFATGDEIGTYGSLSHSGNSHGVKLTLHDVEPLGTINDVFRIVVTQVNEGADSLLNGQWVSIYSYPDGELIVSNLNPQHDQFQGRASSGEHQVFTSQNFFFDVNGIPPSDEVRYGPGLHPLQSEQLPFSSFSSEPPTFPCFALGTLITCPGGPRPIETLRAGDLVETLDHGPRPVSWVGRRSVAAEGPMAPIEIAAGALGNLRRLVVSPQHRMLLRGWQAEMMFGEPEVLVAARHLVNGTTIRQRVGGAVTYLHLLFDRHEVVIAEGIPSESLFLGSEGQKTLGDAAMAEIEALFPELVAGPPVTARPCLSGYEGSLLARVA